METISNERCTIVWLLVPWAQDILEKLDSGELKLNNFNIRQFRLMHIGAQPVPQSLIKRWQAYFPGRRTIPTTAFRSPSARRRASRHREPA